MYNPSLKDFLKLSQKGNVIPVYKEINADLDTPVSAFLKMSKDGYAFLLESVEGQEKIARYSFLGSKPYLVFQAKAKFIQVSYLKNRTVDKYITKSHALDEIRKIMQGFRAVAVKGLPRFYGGLVGYIGYDMARFFEKIPDKNPDNLKLADAVFILTDTMIIFDHVNHTMKILSNVMLPQDNPRLSKSQKSRLYFEAIKKIESIEQDLKKTFIKNQEIKTVKKSNLPVSSNVKRPQFLRMVNEAKRYIRAGDIIQVVLSQRFKVKIKQETFDIYRSLRQTNPSPYMYFLKLKDIFLIGSSPEMLVRCEDGIVQTRPIAGTRWRGRTEKEDLRLQNELLRDKKEKAEHIMLVDLGRNDLGRVCKKGSVEISEFMGVEKYSHVMHLVSEVRGILDKKFDIYELLRACFPAGTVTGSPKIRAMEIIDEMENVRRGPYAGCVGYFSFSHNLDTCITIRTIIGKGNTAYIQAGAGIVADSVPQREYNESVNKARALIEAIVK